MAKIDVPLNRLRFGQTQRKDAWWVYPIAWGIAFLVPALYLNWGLIQSHNYWYPPYLTPLASPLFFGDGPHAWFGHAKPGWWPTALPLMPGILIGFFPLAFRATCYYYRGSYYKAYFADPANCAVGEARHSYSGETRFPFILQNLHRMTLYIALLYLVMLTIDAIRATRFPISPGADGTVFGIGVGTLVMVTNVTLIGCYTLGCHAFRHLVGGGLKTFSRAPVRKRLWGCATCLNSRHGKFAIASLYSMTLTDLYIRLCASGVIRDIRLF